MGTHTTLCYRASDYTFAQGFRRTVLSKKIIKITHSAVPLALLTARAVEEAP